MMDFDRPWKELQTTVGAVLRCDDKLAKARWSAGLTIVYDLCDVYPLKLYKETEKLLIDHFCQLSKEVVLSKEDPESMCSSYAANNGKAADYMKSLYNYFNNRTVEISSDGDIKEAVKDIGDLTKDMWGKLMNRASDFEEARKLFDTIIYNYIANKPQHFAKDLVDYKKIFKPELHEEIFAGPFLTAMEEFYKQEASRILQEAASNCSQYMEKAVAWLKAEEERRKMLYSCGSLYNKVKDECEHRMVGSQLQFLLGECQNILRQDKKSDFDNMATLLQVANSGLPHMIKELQAHIHSEALQATSNVSKETVPQHYVESLLEVYGKFNQLLNRERQFMIALDKTLTLVVNYTEPNSVCKAPELLAKYCDSLLRKPAKGVPENKVEGKVDGFFKIFKYIDDKDVFQKYYARMLAKRFIHGLSLSMDLEEAVISRLKRECGYEYTSKLHRIYTDKTMSDNLNNNFNNFVKKQRNADLGISFQIDVFQTGAWPLTHIPSHTFSIPQELENTVQMFESFYCKQFNGRKLNWLHHLCAGEVKINCLSKAYMVTVNTYQMAVLLAFNNNQAVTYKELQVTTQLNERELQKTIKSLLDIKMLNHDSKKAETEAEAPYSLNMGFTSNRTKVRVAPSMHKDAPQEMEQTRRSIDADRKMYLQATIVRLMKTRRVLAHNALIQEVINQSKSRFNPSISMIKKCIEVLISNEYIERSKSSADKYNYLA